MREREIVNAKITETRLGGMKDRGIPTFWVQLSSGSSGQGFGGYGLAPGFTHAVVFGLLKTLELDSWEDLAGTFVRVDRDWGKVYRIGHLIEERWFDIEVEAARYREEAAK